MKALGGKSHSKGVGSSAVGFRALGIALPQPGQAGSKVGVGTNHLNPLAAEAPRCLGAEVAQDCPRQPAVSMGLPLAALGMLKCPSLSALASPFSS